MVDNCRDQWQLIARNGEIIHWAVQMIICLCVLNICSYLCLYRIEGFNKRSGKKVREKRRRGFDSPSDERQLSSICSPVKMMMMVMMKVMMIGSRLPFVLLSTRIQSLMDPIELPPLCRMFPICLKTPSSHPPPLELTPPGRPGWFLIVVINLYFILSYNFRWTIIAVVRQVPWLQKRAGQPN